jgi:hypothetical protein
MGYYRVTYESYLEDEFNTTEEAKKKFIESMQYDLDSEYSGIVVEEYNEDKGKWETV